MRDIFARPKKRPKQPEKSNNIKDESLQSLAWPKEEKILDNSHDDFFATDLKTPYQDKSKIKKNTGQPSDNTKAQKPQKRKKWPIVLVIILAIILVILGYAYVVIQVPMDKNNNKNIAIDISEGESTFEIADQLKEKNLIRSAWAFATYVKYKNQVLLPGIYYLKQNMNFDKIIENISSGKVQEYKITIPEGWNIEQIAQYLEQKNITKASEFEKLAEGKEGKLFPDTYRVSIDSSSTDILKEMLENFTKRTQGLGLTNDKLILASIVEREARNDQERAKIAGVYQNRLDINIELEADPTVQYAKGNWEAPTVSDYTAVESPYNTYLYKGLPPGPICNPGLASIKAALSPQKHEFFYFFHSNGDTIFSKTKEEHNENKVKYLK